MTDFIDIIERKRDGLELSEEEISGLIAGYVSGEMADYQMAAWLMAAFIKGLSLQETLALTGSMVASGETLDLSPLGRKVLDKHSTGGVGDKVTLVLAPLVASCGAVFGKMSGRGLGHTGGTVDKLESIPGFHTTVSPDDFLQQLEQIGVCVAGQSPGLVPADDMLYSLRDVTATIDSNPLTAASIMSKKIAAGASVVVLDVKVGGGAFFKNRGQAAGVAHLMKEIGKAHDIDVATVMTSMEQPLGHAVGNALEVLEAVDTLMGRGPKDLVEVVTALAAVLLSRGDLGWDRDRAETEVRERLESGAAVDRLRGWIEAQGGDASFIDEPELLPSANHMREVKAPADGYVSAIDALRVGQAVLALGAGRRRKDDAVDHSVGAILHSKVGDRVKRGEPIARVLARTPEEAQAACLAIGSCYKFSSSSVKPPVPVIEVAD